MTTVINEKGEVVQWYFDITLANALTKEGVPYFDDLFLDVVVLPNKDRDGKLILKRYTLVFKLLLM